MQDREEPPRFLPIWLLRPRIRGARFRVSREVEDMDRPCPHGLTSKCLHYIHDLAEGRGPAVGPLHGFLQGFDGDLAHGFKDPAATRSPIVQTRGVTPAAIAGVTRSV